MNVPQSSQLTWYIRRARQMSAAEVLWRARDQAVKAAWARKQVRPGQAATAAPPAAPGGERRFTALLPAGTADLVPAGPRAELQAAANRLLHGEWEVLGVARTDLADPDWFADPVTGRRSPADRYAFRINHRSEADTGNIKQVWEVSRLHHLTVLAAAWYTGRDEACAERVAAQLRSWWQQNPFLSGVHWTSGIEIGIRLISLAWIRRLLDDWPGAAALFEHNDLAVQQIYWHQQYLATFRSRGSSANNHVIAEAAGQLVASCAFGWFASSPRWREQAARLLERELISNTFPSGIGRELASDYQGFVAELGLLAAAETAAAGHPLSDRAWQRLAAMCDSGAALLDERQRPPRQGDGDEGRVLLTDDPERPAWPSLLALGEALAGRPGWWPAPAADVRGTLVSALAGPSRTVPGRPAQRPAHFADAGLTLLRGGGQGPEIWCRCDGGPHGFLSIAAHAHADALSVEVRYGGTDVLADPGTYCYHGEKAWRSYFRSTLAHNTAELDGRNQSTEGGPFLWLRHARTRILGYSDTGQVAQWAAEHDGYTSPAPGATHRRTVRLDRERQQLEITDEFGGALPLRLAFHLGPEVAAELDGSAAILSWPGADAPGTARIALPSLDWRLHRGETDPVLGWYSPGLGRRIPAFTLLGTGVTAPGTPLVTRMEFIKTGHSGKPTMSQSPISWGASEAMVRGAPAGQREAG
ncbi:MAG TPA: alginate lyase family protein [Streptosporangiaceae bacterium]|jgi:hypothetical protein|nr:alginate lyase family protein [Streptosporangiaceae bacterium]